MRGPRTTDWDALAAATPNDATAARVVSPGTDPCMPAVKFPPGYFHSDVCPKLVSPLPERVQALAVEYVGERLGRLTVVGLADIRRGEKKAKWVVRCDCGAFEHRSMQAIRETLQAGQHGAATQCYVCAHEQKVRKQIESAGERTVEDWMARRAARPEPFRLHLSGPMSGYPDMNRPAFNRAAETLRAVDYEVFNPAEIPAPVDYGDGLLRNVQFVLRRAQGQVWLEGYDGSPGSAVERAAAKAMCLPCWRQAPDGRFVPADPQAMSWTVKDLVANAADVRRLLRDG